MEKISISLLNKNDFMDGVNLICLYRDINYTLYSGILTLDGCKVKFENAVVNGFYNCQVYSNNVLTCIFTNIKTIKIQIGSEFYYYELQD